MKNIFFNRIEKRSDLLAGIASDMIPVTPNDSVDLPDVAMGFYIEGAGTIAFTSAAGNNRSINVTDFCQIPCGVKRVLATGTTATGIHAYIL